MRIILKAILFLLFLQNNGYSQSFVTAGMPTPIAQIRDITIDTLGNKMYTVGVQILDGSGMLSLNTAYMYDGNTWTSLDTLYNVTYCSAFYNNELIIGGGFVDSLGFEQKYLSKWTGTKWVHFGDTIDGPINGLKVIDSSLYVMGGFSQIGGINCNGIAKWDGTTWSNMYSAPFVTGGFIVSDCIFYNGDLYIGGNFSDIPSNIVDLARWNPLLSIWEKVGDSDCLKGGLGSVWSIEVYENELYVGGYIGKFEGNVGHGIQKWNGTNWSEVGTGVKDNSNSYSSFAPVYDLMLYQNKLFVVGAFWYSGNIYGRGFSTWDGNQWCVIDTTFIGAVKLGVLDDTLFVSSGMDTVSGIYINNLAKFTDLTPDSCSIGFSIDEVGELGSISIYPNPNNGSFKVDLNKPTSGTLKIMNSLGQLVFSKELMNETIVNLNLSNSSKGIYFVCIKTDNIVVTEKIIKE